MIKANELRIGNKLLHHGKIISVSGITDETNTYNDCFLIWYEGLAYNISEFNPIPLTPEIIKKFDDEQIRRCGNFFTIIRVNGLPYIGKIDNGVNVKYLHEFQNIFRDYAGEELEIKELQSA